MILYNFYSGQPEKPVVGSGTVKRKHENDYDTGLQSKKKAILTEEEKERILQLAENENVCMLNDH